MLPAAIAIVMALGACGAGPAPTSAQTAAGLECSAEAADRMAISESILDAVRAPGRPSADLERDARSRPAELLAFVGVRPGMAVLDVNSAGGYYAELLSRVVGPEGRVLAHNHPGARAALGEAVFARRYGGGRLPNVETVFARHGELELAPASLDAVLMSLVFHDFYWHDAGVDWGPIDVAALLAEIREALRPGAVVGVVDHRGPGGADPAASAVETHRIDPAVVIRDFEAAGFVLDAESDLLRNAADDLSLGVFDPRVQGRTDRFVLVFRRPCRNSTARRQNRVSTRSVARRGVPSVIEPVTESAFVTYSSSSRLAR